jgi:hypothetical protein
MFDKVKYLCYHATKGIPSKTAKNTAMKKLLFITFVMVFIGTSAFAQTYGIKDNGRRKVLTVNGEEFTGKRQELWKIEKNLAPQPVSSELVLLSTMESTATDVWQYFLYRLIDGKWEYIATFPGGTAPIVTLDEGLFTAFQMNGTQRINYHIDEIVLTSYPSQRRWELRKMNY